MRARAGGAAPGVQHLCLSPHTERIPYDTVDHANRKPFGCEDPPVPDEGLFGRPETVAFLKRSTRNP
eukprot:2703908-Prymnesium_polylepis.2